MHHDYSTVSTTSNNTKGTESQWSCHGTAQPKKAREEATDAPHGKSVKVRQTREDVCNGSAALSPYIRRAADRNEVKNTIKFDGIS